MIREILVMHHSHTDIGFTHPQPVWLELSRRYIDEALDLCEETAGWPEEARLRWTCESTLPVMNWLEHAPSRQVERFRQLAAAGQISVAALPCNLTMLPDLEQLTRGLQPVDWLRREFGLPVKSAIAHDVNGMPWPATQLFLDAGIELLIMGVNVFYGGYPLHRPMAFHWQGADGRSLLSFNGEHYSFFGKIANTHLRKVEEMAPGIASYIQSLPADYPYDFIFLTATHRPYHNDNNPPDPWLAGLVRQWNAEGRQPRIRLVTPETLLERLRQQPAAAIPTHAGDWTDNWAFGLGSAAFETRVGLGVRSRLVSADLARLAARRNTLEDEARLKTAYDALTLWAEHTWGADSSLGFADSDYAREQEAHKMSYVYQARSQANLLMRDQLEALSGLPPAAAGGVPPVGGRLVQAHGMQGVLVFNPAPAARKAFIRLPGGMDPQSYLHSSAMVMRLDEFMELTELSQGGTLIGPLEVPASGWVALPYAALTPAGDPPGVTTGADWMETPSHRLTFDPQSGRILSLVDKLTGWEAIDRASPWDFGGLVHESVDPQKYPLQRPDYGHAAVNPEDWVKMDAGISLWQPDWPALRQTPEALLECRLQTTPQGPALVRRWQCGGVLDLVQRITLLAHRPALRIDTRFHLPEQINAEAFYLTFPFDLPDWQLNFDSAELPVAYDDEQLPGACRGWLSPSHWIDMHNTEHGVTLANPDAPLFQPGGFNWGQFPGKVKRAGPGLLLAWLANNYWNCNFPADQPGPVRISYELTTHAAFDVISATLFGLQAARPVEVHPLLNSTLAPRGQVVTVEGEGVVLLHAGPGDNGTGVRLRLANLTDHPAEAAIRLPGRTILSGNLLDTLHHPLAAIKVDGNCARVTLPARTVQMVWLEAN